MNSSAVGMSSPHVTAQYQREHEHAPKHPILRHLSKLTCAATKRQTTRIHRALPLRLVRDSTARAGTDTLGASMGLCANALDARLAALDAAVERCARARGSSHARSSAFARTWLPSAFT